MKSLTRHRILLCGKGGCGKSSVTAMLARALQSRGHAVVLLDGDASNPGGLARLVLGPADGPAPLFEFFGGREKVTCPVDDEETETAMRTALALRGVPILGKIRFDPSVRLAGLKGEAIRPCSATEDAAVLTRALEEILAPD